MLKKITPSPLAAALVLLISGHALAGPETPEVNPFAGTHGGIEALRLETEKTHQESELMKERIELKRRQLELEGVATAPDDATKVPSVTAAPAPPQPKPPVSDKPADPSTTIVHALGSIVSALAQPGQTGAPAKPAPKVMKLTGVIDTATGRQAVVVRGDESWTVAQGDRLGKWTVRRIDPSRLTFSNGHSIPLEEGAHAVATGMMASTTPRGASASATLPGLPGSVSDEMRAIMNVTGAPAPAPGQPYSGPSQAKFN